VHQPQVLDRAAAGAAFDAFQLRAMERFGIDFALQLTEKKS
jgi:hypothetical protein